MNIDFDLHLKRRRYPTLLVAFAANQRTSASASQLLQHHNHYLHNTTALMMQRVVPQRARQLWGHAPRVRSFNRRHRTFATVSGTSQYDIPVFENLSHDVFLTMIQALRCHCYWWRPRRLRSLCSSSAIRCPNGPHNPKARQPRRMLMQSFVRRYRQRHYASRD